MDKQKIKSATRDHAMQRSSLKKVTLLTLLFIPQQAPAPSLRNIPQHILNRLRGICSPHTQDTLCGGCHLPLDTKSPKLTDMPFTLQCNHRRHIECAYSPVYKHRSQPRKFLKATCTTCESTITQEDQEDLRFLYNSIKQYPMAMKQAPTVSRILNQRKEQVKRSSKEKYRIETPKQTTTMCAYWSSSSVNCYPWLVLQKINELISHAPQMDK